MNFDWGDHRKARWVRLCAAILGDECRARTLTALLNLRRGRHNNENAISEADLRRGWADQIRPLLPQVRPRIVCALTNRVWNTIASDLDGLDCGIEKCPFKLARELIAFKIRGCNFTSVLIKPHNHPSRFLSNKQIEQIGRASQWLMTELA